MQPKRREQAKSSSAALSNSQKGIPLQQLAFSHQQSAISGQQSAISSQPSAVSNQPNIYREGCKGLPQRARKVQTFAMIFLPSPLRPSRSFVQMTWLIADC
jgi:hypothetical protein